MIIESIGVTTKSEKPLILKKTVSSVIENRKSCYRIIIMIANKQKQVDGINF